MSTFFIKARKGIARRFFCIIIAFSMSFGLSLSIFNNVAAAIVNKSGTISSNEIWTSDNVYYVIGDISIASSVTLTIQAGTIVKMGQYRQIIANGVLDVQGTSGSPVIFTSFKDDSHGGDTNGDGSATSPAAGDWYQIAFNGTSSGSSVQYATIQYAGYNYNRGIYINGSSPTIANSLITRNTTYNIYLSSSNATITGNTSSYASYGIYVSGGSPTISNNNFNNNTSYGVYKAAAPTLIAENNWWGDATGPYHPTSNPSGIGNRVSDNVDFTPWLTSPVTPADTIPPATIVSLSARTGSNSGEVRLSWVAPGDDGYAGIASTYIVRYSTSLITTEINWSAATDASGEPAPTAALTVQSMTITGLEPGRRYFFAIRTQDEALNLSSISNSPSATASSTDDKSMAYSGSASLYESANIEMRQIQTNTVDVITSGGSSAIIDGAEKLLLIDDKIDDLSKAVGDKLGGYDGKIGADFIFSGAEKLIEDTSQSGVNYAVGQTLQSVNNQTKTDHASFNTWIASHNVTWGPTYNQLVIMYEDTILDRYESEPVGSIGTKFPYLGTGTMEGGVNSFDIVATIAKIIGTLITVLLIAGLIISLASLAGVSLGGAIPAILAAIPVLIEFFSWVKFSMSMFNLLLALSIWAAGVGITGPSVAIKHADAIQTFEVLLPSASGKYFDQFSTKVNIRGDQLSETTSLHNADSQAASPLVQTVIYGADGHVVNIFTDQPTIKANGVSSISNNLSLRPGKYRVVSLVSTRDTIGLASTNVNTFEIQSAQPQLLAELSESQLTQGQAIEATISVSNSSTTNSANLTLIAWIQEDGQKPTVWQFTLGPSGQRTFTFSGVPNGTGAGAVKIGVSDGMNTLADETLPFVVGQGVSVAANLIPAELYPPSSNVVVPVHLINAGTESTTATISLKTYQKDNPGTILYTDEHNVNLSAASEQTINTTWLPAASPERYQTIVYLNNDPINIYDFIVEASDTLFVLAYPDQTNHSVSDEVSLYFDVTNSEMVYTGVPIVANIILPNGTQEDLVLSTTNEGRYQATYSPLMSGTFTLQTQITAPAMRVVYKNSYFFADQTSSLVPSYTGSLVLNSLSTISFTVKNEHGISLGGVNVALQNASEAVSGITDINGQIDLAVKPASLASYQLVLTKSGYTDATSNIPVEQPPDITAPSLFLIAPEETNQSTQDVQGVTEPGVTLTVEGALVNVDENGYFSTNVALAEGDNLIQATATDSSENTTLASTHIFLDSIPPTLTISNPDEGSQVEGNAVEITGFAEVEAVITVNGMVKIQSSPGDFGIWVYLEPGDNTLEIKATDEAGNIITVIRNVTSVHPMQYSIFLPFIRR
jgi:parallel beta-helix repeat protein